ncbi:hypothetical protein TNCT_516101 [Trichonephila clavata]|uniref:Uncharacterized protein n=1 Tax=Trichonephila clavata TaxID=2740835 RepID=A0A8X6LFV1_TRICU|nr:hypothetical protein TNCT_516101 [Trichonephila clavata]
METKLVPSLEEMALMKVAVAIYSKLKVIKKTERGVRRVLSGTPDDELPIIKEIVPKLGISKVFHGKLKNMLTLLSFERHRRDVERKLLKDKKYSQGGKMESRSEDYEIYSFVKRTCHGKTQRRLRKIPSMEEENH